MAKISVYDKLETSFFHNGTVLPDTTFCSVEQKINDKYVLELTHPIDENGKWLNLIEENIIKADGQLFRIHSTEKNLGYINVYARHIFYDLLHNFLEDVRPTMQNGGGALNTILTGTQYPHDFIGISNIDLLNTQYYVRKNPIEAMLGADSLVTRWGGELKRDNYTISLLTSLGNDKGATIAYGKNMLGLEVKKNMDTVVTRIMPVGTDGLMLPEKYVDSLLINNYVNPKIATMNFDIGVNETTTKEQAYVLLRQACNDLYNVNKIDIPFININANLLMLENTEEYKDIKNLVKVNLGDIVSCTDNPLNITFTSKIIRIKKDVLSNKNVEVELGQFEKGISNIVDNAIKDISEELQHSTSAMQKAIDHATELLTNALGGYVTKRPGEILIMDTEDINTATKVWRWNLNGLGYSNNGVNGPYETAMTMDGWILGKHIDFEGGRIGGYDISGDSLVGNDVILEPNMIRIGKSGIRGQTNSVMQLMTPFLYVGNSGGTGLVASASISWTTSEGNSPFALHTNGSTSVIADRLESHDGTSGDLNISGSNIYMGGHTKPVATSWDLDLGDSSRRWRNAYLSNQPNVSSDQRLKNNIHEIPQALIYYLKEIKPKMYLQKNKWHFGYIAQDVERALYKYSLDKVGFKDAWGYVKKFAFLCKDESYMSLLYGEIAVLKEKEMQDRIDCLEVRLEKLESVINEK